MVLGNKEDGHFDFRHTEFDVTIDIQVELSNRVSYMGLKLRRFGLEIQMWKSLATGGICSHASGPEYPGSVYKMKREEKRAWN